MTLRFLFYLGHPAHYHNLKHSIRILLKMGHAVKVVARGKDVLFDLLDGEDWDLELLEARKTSGTAGMALSIAGREWRMLRIALKFKPDLMAGTDLVITHVGKVIGVPSLVINEDDSAAIPLMARYAFPYATGILAPNCCDQSPANGKKIGYEGYHELAYLHPALFNSSRTDLPPVFQESDRYFILRYAALNAHHDAGRKGISDELALKLINILKPHGRVFITSERPFDERLEPYRIPVHPSKMHHVLAHASIYIGDSQTMAAEAAVLGVPSIRYNDFVGDLAYLEELEHKYGLTKGIRAGNPDELLNLVADWVCQADLDATWQKRRAAMLEATVEVTPFWVETFLDFASRAR